MAVSLDLQDLHEAFMANIEIVDTETGDLIRMAEFERRASRRPEGLVIVPPSGAIALPPPA